MLRAPSRSTLRKLFRKEVVLKRYTYGPEDSYGQKAKTGSETYPLKAEIQEIVAEDAIQLVPAELGIGDAYGFFLPSYIVKGQTIIIALEDEVIWNYKTWRIENIEDYYIGKKLSHKRALLKRVV